MSGPPVRDQKLAPSQLTGRPPVMIFAAFLRMRLISPRSGPDPGAWIEALYRLRCQRLNVPPAGTMPAGGSHEASDNRRRSATGRGDQGGRLVRAQRPARRV